LKDVFGEEIEFEEKGQPTDFASAKPLTELDKFQFQHWALSLIDARPLKEGKARIVVSMDCFSITRLSERIY
jgi:site-specific DNA-methyltransferase (adenine-specific)